MKQIIRKLSKRYPYFAQIIREILLKIKKPICVKKNGKPKVLICYITRPFSSKNYRGHSNQKEVIVMSDVLMSLGYEVYVIDYNSTYDIDYSVFSLLIGFGLAFSRSFNLPLFFGKRICFFTGANMNFSNEAEAKRCKNLSKRKGVLLSPKREAYWPWMFSAINSDAIFILGNQWTLSTFKGLNDNNYLLPVPFVEPLDGAELNAKDFTKIGCNFCWFAGSGAVHKGLDLILDSLDQLADNFHLDICGAIETELDFLELYKNQLYSDSRVNYHGLVDVNSTKMQEIINANAFVILPSCSEGTASSVLTCMSVGMIPIVTVQTGIDIEDFGLLIESDTLDSIIEAISIATSLSEDELKLRSKKASDFVKSKHSYDTYAKILTESLHKVIF